MRTNFVNGLTFGAGILLVVVVGIAVAVAADILTVDKDGTIRLRVSDTGKVTLNTNEPAQGDMRFTPRSGDPTAPLEGDIWYNSADKEVKYADGGLTKPLAEMTNAAISLYVNGTTGNDNNNGLSSGAAVQTIQKAVNLVPPIVRHAVTINVAAGVYRDQGALVGSSKVNVYVADKVVTAGGSIVFQGGSSLADAPNYRVTGSNSGADTTPVRNYGFYIHKVQNVYIRGFQCDYFFHNGLLYVSYSSGSPTSCVCDNNLQAGIVYIEYSSGTPNACQANSNGLGGSAVWPKAGILYSSASQGNPASCTASNNGYYGISYMRHSDGWPSSCTANGNGTSGITYGENSVGGPINCAANGNWYHGIDVGVSSRADPSGCSVSLNGTTGSGWGYGIHYGFNAVGWPSNCASPSGNNQSGGLRVESGSRVDRTDPMPNGNDSTADAASQLW